MHTHTYTHTHTHTQEIKLGSEPSVPREDMVGPGSMLPIRPLRNPSLGPET
jgi:hypothetical protein